MRTQSELGILEHFFSHVVDMCMNVTHAIDSKVLSYQGFMGRSFSNASGVWVVLFVAKLCQGESGSAGLHCAASHQA